MAEVVDVVADAVHAAGALHRLAAQVAFALRKARAASVDSTFLVPFDEGLRSLGCALRPSASVQPDANLRSARPDVSAMAKLLAVLAGGIGQQPLLLQQLLLQPPLGEVVGVADDPSS